MKKKHLLDEKTTIILGIIFVLIGVYILSYNYLKSKKDKVFETINFELLLRNDDDENYIVNNTDDLEEHNGDNLDDDNIIEDNDNNMPYYYIGTLEIPKINLKKGFLDINSKDNYVDRNIQVIKTSNYPDVENGNFIIAGHSGNSHVGFFNKLYKLVVDDVAYVYYNNIKYTYKIVNIYTQPKTGVIGIYRNLNKTTLTLITCTNNDKTTQTIYIAELIDKEEY